MEEKMFCVRKSKKLFPCSTFVLFITAVDKKTSESKNEENNETYTVLGKMNQVMAENDFNDYGRNFSEECCPQMLSCRGLPGLQPWRIPNCIYLLFLTYAFSQ